MKSLFFSSNDMSKKREAKSIPTDDDVLAHQQRVDQLEEALTGTTDAEKRANIERRLTLARQDLSRAMQLNLPK